MNIYVNPLYDYRMTSKCGYPETPFESKYVPR